MCITVMVIFMCERWELLETSGEKQRGVAGARGMTWGFFFPVVVTAQTGEAANESAADRG